MPWPVDDLSTADLDSGADTPPRAEFFKLFQRVKAMIAARGTAEGVASLDARRRVPDAELGRAVAGGVASLDGSGRVPAAQLDLPPPPKVWRPGDIKVHAGPDVEEGWLLAAGGTASRSEDAALFAAIGTRWGEGDGATTFGLPDFMDTFLLGASATRPVGTTGGAETVALTAAQNGPHRHLVVNSANSENTIGSANHAIARMRAPNRGYDEKYILSGTGAEPSMGRTTSEGEGEPHNNMPPFAAVLVLIKR